MYKTSLLIYRETSQITNKSYQLTTTNHLGTCSYYKLVEQTKTTRIVLQQKHLFSQFLLILKACWISINSLFRFHMMTQLTLHYRALVSSEYCLLKPLLHICARSKPMQILCQWRMVRIVSMASYHTLYYKRILSFSLMSSLDDICL